MFRTVKTTRKARRSVSPQPAGLDSMSTFFTAESVSAFLKPWLRLERGLRIQRLRQFAEDYPDLTAEEKDALFKFLVKTNDAKQLNTKQQIQYDEVEGKIVGIRGLKWVRMGTQGTQGTREAATIQFKIEPPRSVKRKHKDDTDIPQEVEKIEGSLRD
jgi:hypothetical protein